MRTQFEVSAPKNLPVATMNSPKPARSCQTMKNASTRAAASSAIIMAMEAVRCALNIGYFARINFERTALFYAD